MKKSDGPLDIFAETYVIAASNKAKVCILPVSASIFPPGSEPVPLAPWDGLHRL